MFVTCNTLWTTLLNKWGMTTQAQKDAFCAIVNTCIDNSTEVVAGLGIPTLPPSNGEKVVVVQGVGGAPNQAYFWTGTQWILMGDGVGLSGVTLGSGGNVTLTGDGTAASPLVGNVTFPAPPPAPASTCEQVLATPAGVIQAVFGHDSAGSCVREAVTVAPTLCQEIAALPAGAIATVVGRDASGNCVTGTVSGGSSAPAATDAVAGISALNLGNDLPADATNATDALTASGLIGILGQAGGNAMVSALCGALQSAGCVLSGASQSTGSLIMDCLSSGLNIYNPQLARLQYNVSTPTTQPFSIEKYNGSSWANIFSGNTSMNSIPAGAPPEFTPSASAVGDINETLPQGVGAYYRLIISGVAQPPVVLVGSTCPAEGV